MGCRRRIVVVLAAAAGPAVAIPVSFGSTASITGLSYRLVDLAPDDGIDPGITFLSSPAAPSLVEAELVDQRGRVIRSDSKLAGEGLTLVSLAGQDGQVTGALVMSGGAASSAFSSGAVAQGGRVAGYSTASHFNVLAELTPHTAVEWTANYTLTAWATPSGKASADDGARAVVVFGFSGSNYAVNAWANPSRGPSFMQQSGVGVWGMGNGTDVVATARSSFGTFITGGRGDFVSIGNSVVPAVPEPSTYLLMFAGLGVVGAAARKRSKAT
jgi:hypothetical protein